MRFTRRRAVSPIIATLLLIAIAVAAAIIVYVFVNSISGNLTQQGGQQVSDQVSMDAYTFSTPTSPQMVLRNVGSSSVVISYVYYNGNLCQTVTGDLCNVPAFASGTCTTGATSTCTAGQYTQLTLTLTTAATSGTSNLIRVVTSDGGTFTFTVLAGRSG
jgi:archaeal type IV pilus assembly protein PilA